MSRSRTFNRTIAAVRAEADEAALREREECAKVAMNLISSTLSRTDNPDPKTVWAMAVEVTKGQIADAIRARTLSKSPAIR